MSIYVYRIIVVAFRIYRPLNTGVLIPTQFSVHIFEKTTKGLVIAGEKKHRHHLLLMHTQILVLNYMHSYFITVHHVRNSNRSWCLSAALDDNKIPCAFLSLEAKEGETHLHSKIASHLRFYIAFNSFQLLGG